MACAAWNWCAEALRQQRIARARVQPDPRQSRKALFEEAIALARRGCTIDITAFPVDCPSKVADGDERGWIVPIGGAENKETTRASSRFVDLCGGEDARHRGHPDRQPAGRHRRRATRDLPRARRRAGGRAGFRHPPRLPRSQPPGSLRRASGVFFTGGNQLRLSTILGGTAGGQADPRAQRRRRAGGRHQRRRQHPQRAHDRVRHEGASPRADSVRLAPGWA
jgi:cyanophycinase